MSHTDPPAGRSFSISEIASLVQGELRGSGAARITGVNTLVDAEPGDITFIMNARYAAQWAASRADAAIISRSVPPPESSRPLIVVADAEAGMNRLLELFCVPEPVPTIGIEPSAIVHPSASLGHGVRIGAHVSIDAECEVGDGVVLHAGVRLYPRVTVGSGSVIHANTVIRHGCVLGRNVILHQNVSIGADGFGYRPSPAGDGLLKVRHIGNVVIGDDVEIGANSCVDRAKFACTVIGRGTKIDNLVQVAHNCRIGENCLIAALCGLAGSMTLGNGVMLGGAAAVAPHMTLGDGCRIGARAAVMNDVPAGETWYGMPAQPSRALLRQEASIRKLPDVLRRLSGLLPPENR